MSYKWTRATARKLNLVDAKVINDEYDSYKSTINGGIDRDNLPNSSIAGASQVSVGAIHKYVTQPGLSMDAAICDSYLSDYGVIYDKYSGGWRLDSTNIEEAFTEGMLTVEFNCWHWIWDASGAFYGEQFMEFEILIDGNPIAYSERIYASMGTVHMVASIPISSGKHKLEMRWRCSAPENGASNTQPVCYYGGGSLTAINRIR